jgi:hypothetical protein
MANRTYEARGSRFTRRVMPGLIFSVAFAISAACGSSTDPDVCPPVAPAGAGGGGGVATTTTGGTGGDPADGGTTSGNGGSSESPPGGGPTTGNEDNTFDHFNDPGESGQKDPFEILKERAAEGPPEIRTRLHSCSKIPYSALGEFLTSRGVNLALTAGPGELPTAGDLYRNGGDAMGVARYPAREGETYFHTTAGATKLFDIFVQAAPEIIAGVQSAAACQLNGVGRPMFDADDGSCVYESLSCIMGRPASEDDMVVCNLMLAQANNGDLTDVARKRQITVAAFLSAAHSCE